MRHLILAFMVLLSATTAHSQITGVVSDARTQEPIAGAIVSLLDSSGSRIAVVSSRVNGEFKFQSTAYTIRIRHQGYRDTTLSLRFANVVVMLTPSYQSGSEVTVTANRVATAVQDLAVSTVTARAAEIQSRSPQGLNHILRAVPGVTVTESQVSIRGSSGYARAVGSRVLLLLDGMPFLSGDNGDMKFDAIPFPAVDRVEVIKGAGSALYGSNAIGGVINILTRDPKEQWKGGVAITAGQYDKPKYEQWQLPELTGRFYNLDAGIENKWEDVGVLATGSYRKNEGYRFGDDLERYNIFAKGIYSKDPELTLRASALIAKDEHGGWLYWKSLSQPYMDGDSLNALKGRTHSDRFNLLLGSDYIFGEHLWITKANFFSTQYITDSIPELDDVGATSRSKVVGIESFINSTLSSSFNSTFGINVNNYSVSSTVLSDQTALGLASFLQLEYRPLAELTLLPGVRFDHFKANDVDADQQLSPKFGVNYRPFEEIALRGSLGTGFRVPTLTERFINSTLAGFTVLPNPLLKPEKTVSYEVGAMYRDEMWTLDGAVFHSTYEDMIEPQFVGDKIQFNNITSARQFGHEQFAEIRPFSSELVKARVGYTYVYSEDRDSKKVLQHRPRHLLQARGEWNPGGVSLSADLRYISAYEETDSTLSRIIIDGDERNSTYVLDARGAVDLKTYFDIPIKLTLQVQNLLNYYYVEIVGNIGPLRSYSLKLETTL